jgi:HSP20 family protein
MVMRVRDPFDALLGLQEVVESAFRPHWLAGPRSGARAFPLVNVFDDRGDFVVVAELPGVPKEDLDIEVHRDTVRIRGKKTVARDENATVHRRERVAGRFDRTVTLPDEIDADRVSAEYRDGVLTLRLPRAASAKPRTIAVN